MSRSLGNLWTTAFFLLWAVVMSAGAAVGADEWPQFRGPHGDGHVTGVHLPLRFGPEHVAWQQSVDRGHSSPVVTGRHLWVTAARETELSEAEQAARLAKVKNPRGLKIAGRVLFQTLCFDTRTGRREHRLMLRTVDDPEPIHALNTYASPTPVTGDGRVYCHFGSYGTFCIEDRTGRVLWKNTSLHVDHQNGPGASPVLWQDLLIVHFDGTDRQFLIAFDTGDGTIRWKTERSGEMHPRPEFRKAYATPVIIPRPEGDLLVSPAANWVYAYDPRTGQEIWRCHYGQLGFSTVPKPVYGHGMVYVVTSFIQSRLLAIRYNGEGEITKTHVAWTSDSQIPSKPSLLLVGNELFFVNDNGVATCLDARTGERLWRARLDGQYSASPLYNDGRIFFFSQEGLVTVIEAAREFRLLAKYKPVPVAPAEGFMASPAVADGALFLRVAGRPDRLYRLEIAGRNGARDSSRAATSGEE